MSLENDKPYTKELTELEFARMLMLIGCMDDLAEIIAKTRHLNLAMNLTTISEKVKEIFVEKPPENQQ